MIGVFLVFLTGYIARSPAIKKDWLCKTPRFRSVPGSNKEGKHLIQDVNIVIPTQAFAREWASERGYLSPLVARTNSLLDHTRNNRVPFALNQAATSAPKRCNAPWTWTIPLCSRWQNRNSESIFPGQPINLMTRSSSGRYSSPVFIDPTSVLLLKRISNE